METGGPTFNFCGNSSQVIGSEDGEIWIGSGSLIDPLRPSTSIMQNSHRRKRQNCGSSSQGHHTTATALGSAEYLGLVSMATEESMNHSRPVFSGVHRGMNQGGRLNPRSLQFNGFEPGNSSSPRFLFNDGVPTDASWNAMPSGSTLQQPGNSVGGLTNSSYTYVSDQGRNSYKRKSSMDTYPGPLTQVTSSSIGESSFPRYTQGPGVCRSDTSFGSICDEPGVRRDVQDAYHPFRTSALLVNHYDGITTSTRENYYCSSIAQNERALLAPRRMGSRSGTINETVGNLGINHPETLPLRQENGVGSWRRHNTSLEEGSNHLETMRNLNFFSDGNYLRQGEALDMIDIDTRLPQLSNRVMRPPHFQEYISRSSHHTHHLAPNPYAYMGTVNINPSLFPGAQPSSSYNNIHTQVVLPSSGSATTISGMTLRPQAAFGDSSSGNMPGQFLPRYSDTSRALYPRQLSFRGSRALPSDGVNRHRFSASHHGLSNQGLPYEWADTYDQHSDMRLDVDNMSYEELLALEERMGNVNTGLDEENIHKCLKMSTYLCSDVTVGPDSQESDSKCSVCQEEYLEGDELGELQCGHGYHTDCIKQWLLLKNQCPICKAAAS